MIALQLYVELEVGFIDGPSIQICSFWVTQMYNLILSLMPWRDILTHGLKGWRKTKHTEYYDAYELEADPEIQVEVYVLDYIPPNDTKLYQYRLHSTHPFIPQILDMTTPQTSKEVFTRLIL